MSFLWFTGNMLCQFCGSRVKGNHVESTSRVKIYNLTASMSLPDRLKFLHDPLRCSALSNLHRYLMNPKWHRFDHTPNPWSHPRIPWSENRIHRCRLCQSSYWKTALKHLFSMVRWSNCSKRLVCKSHWQIERSWKILCHTTTVQCHFNSTLLNPSLWRLFVDLPVSWPLAASLDPTYSEILVWSLVTHVVT